METKATKENGLYSIMVLYDMHSLFFTNVIEGISDNDAQQRLNTKANHIAWITGSLVHERYELANALGVEMKQTSNELFKDHKGIQDDINYPSLAEFKKDWGNITPVLRKTLINLTDEQLDRPFEMPGETMTFFDLIAYLTHREAYCIGQIGLWRRLLGYEPMKYQ
jgi:hypothetical protein